MDALQSTGKILRPFHLVKNLRYISSNFRYSRQEDAHEYMVNLLESMHKCCLPNGVSSESPSAYEKSQVHKIFGGQLRSQVKCLRCSYSSNNFDPFLDLSLEIMRADSLYKALTHFTGLELLDGGERLYQCQRCKKKVEASKQLTIHKAPYVLAIHFKRFDSGINGEKLSKKVVYGPTLNLNPFISDPCEGDYKYTLYGVLVHAGWTTYSGHYFCFVRTSTGLWYWLDDNQVTEVSEQTVLSREAYMLFYVRNRTSGVKGAAEVVPKSDFSSPAANKEIPLVEIKPSTAIYSSIQPKDDRPHIELVPAMGALLQESVKSEGLFFNKDEKVETKYSNLQINDGEFTNIHQTSLSHEPTKPLPLMDSKLPSDGDNNKKGDTSNKMETDLSPSRDDFEEVLRQSNTMNDSTLNEAVVTTLLHNQETCENIITENLLYSSHQSESKLKTPRKSSSEKGGFFGRKLLFLMSLHHPKNKQMKRKKQHIAFRKKISTRIVNDPNADSHEASTSKNFQAIDVSSRHLPRKHPQSINRKSKGKKGIKHGSRSVYTEEFNRSTFCSNEEDSSVKINYVEDTDILKQTSVARCDDQNFQVMQMNEIQYNSKRNIGYVLDENHEDYEKHKRKKVKKYGQLLEFWSRNHSRKQPASKHSRRAE